MTTVTFWKTLAKQAVAVMAGAAFGLLPAAVDIVGNGVDWKTYAVSVGLAGAAVLLKGIAASQVGDPTSPNFKAPPE